MIDTPNGKIKFQTFKLDEKLAAVRSWPSVWSFCDESFQQQNIQSHCLNVQHSLGLNEQLLNGIRNSGKRDADGYQMVWNLLIKCFIDAI